MHILEESENKYLHWSKVAPRESNVMISDDCEKANLPGRKNTPTRSTPRETLTTVRSVMFMSLIMVRWITFIGAKAHSNGLDAVGSKLTVA